MTCRTCSFTYIGESRRNWKSRGVEHKPGTNGNVNSAIKQHAETGHDIHPIYANILETGVSGKNKRLLVESLHSFLDKSSVNEIPRGQRTITSQLIEILWIARNHHSLKETAEGGRKFRDNFLLFRSVLNVFTERSIINNVSISISLVSRAASAV